VSSSNEDQRAASKFGTFGGVFTPCTLTILGVIMFLRFGRVVGQSGLMYAVLIILISKSITLLTSLSLSAIATNTRVKGGGAYFLISRSLGVEFGGAIGVVFFLAQAISVSMYIIGFSEAFLQTFSLDGVSLSVVATTVNLGVFVCVLVGASWAVKVQYAILVILIGSLVSFSIGALQSFSTATLQINLEPHFVGSDNFFTMFALFFPAVTGIMAGANMSGDLRNPARSIPRGTLAAVGVTALVYAGQAVLLAGSRTPEELVGNNLIIREISWAPIWITAGVFAATLSSALGSMMGAPRILQAFARDDVFKSLKLFAKGSGSSDEPRRATVVTCAISQACILLGDLDAIAPVITMAFMITYGTLNLATFYESITKNPSYRPRFRYSHWSTALLGTLGCLAVMLCISPLWAVVSIAFMIALLWFINFRGVQARWGDLQSGILVERTRKNLLKLEKQLYHPKNWRPVIVVLSGHGWTRRRLAVYGHWLTTGHGLLTLAHVIYGDVEEKLEDRAHQEKELRRFIREQRLEAFPEVVVTPFLSAGIESLVQCHGLGGIRPNTFLLGWPGKVSGSETFGSSVRLVARLERSVICVKLPPAPEGEDLNPWEVPPGTIDVWWRGMQNGALMLLLAHLLLQSNEWRSRTIRLLRVVASPAEQADVNASLQELATSSRIDATPTVVVADDVPTAIRETSRSAAVVILGFEAPQEGEEEAFYLGMERLVGDLPHVIFVDSAGGMELES